MLPPMAVQGAAAEAVAAGDGAKGEDTAPRSAASTQMEQRCIRPWGQLSNRSAVKPPRSIYAISYLRLIYYNLTARLVI